MLDIGWSEMLIIGVVALVVIGPKELPGALKTFAYWMKQARKLAREFQSGVDDMIRQAELDAAGTARGRGCAAPAARSTRTSRTPSIRRARSSRRSRTSRRRPPVFPHRR